MSEEEIINYLKELTKPPLRPEWDFAYKLDKKTADIIQGLLDLYNKEKERYELLFNGYNKLVYKIENEYVTKDKIREKIEELKKEALADNISLELFYRKKYCIEILEELIEEE